MNLHCDQCLIINCTRALGLRHNHNGQRSLGRNKNRNRLQLISHLVEFDELKHMPSFSINVSMLYQFTTLVPSSLLCKIITTQLRVVNRAKPSQLRQIRRSSLTLDPDPWLRFRIKTRLPHTDTCSEGGKETLVSRTLFGKTSPFFASFVLLWSEPNFSRNFLGHFTPAFVHGYRQPTHRFTLCTSAFCADMVKVRLHPDSIPNMSGQFEPDHVRASARVAYAFCQYFLSK